MKILQICSGFDIGFDGGITNYVRNISNTLVEAQHQVTVIYSSKAQSANRFKFKTICITPELEPFHLSSVITNSDVSKIKKIVLNEKPDVVHVHMMIDLPLDVLSVFSEYSKLVISLHDYSYVCNRIVLIRSDNTVCKSSNENRDCNFCIQRFEAIDNRLLRYLTKKTVKLVSPNTIIPSGEHHEKFVKAKVAFEKASAVLAVSSRVKEIYENNGFINNNFIINHIGNYTAEDEFRRQFLNRKPIPRNKKIKFGFIGNLVFLKGSKIFLQLIENSEHEFHIYGGIASSVLEEIKNKKNVIYHGRYRHEQLADILQNIDIGLVLPLWEDNAPQVVFEFLNAGIPVIGTRIGGLPDFINPSNGYLFDLDVRGIDAAKAFMSSVELYDFYNAIVNKITGTKKAAEHAKELIQIYSSL